MQRATLISFALITILGQVDQLCAELPPLIPRDALFGNPDKSNPRISPDGKRLAYLAPDHGVLNVWVRTVGKSDDIPITHDRRRGIRSFFWARNNDQILYIQDRDGDENWHVFSVDVAEGQGVENKTGDVSLLVHVTPGADRESIRAYVKRIGGEIRYEYKSALPDVMNLRRIPADLVQALEGVQGVAKIVIDQYHANVTKTPSEADAVNHMAQGKDLTPFENVQARIIATDSQFPDEILVTLNKDNPSFHDVYRLNVRTGELTLLARNEKKFVGWIADHDFRIRAALNVTPRGGTQLHIRNRPDEPWRLLYNWRAVDAMNSGPIGFTPDGKSLYVVSSVRANTGQLRRMDLSNGKEHTIAYDRNADLSDILIHPKKKHVQAVAYNKKRVLWSVLDKDIAGDFKTLRNFHRGNFGVINRDDADHIWLVHYDVDDGPIHYYAYDRRTKQASLLFTNRRALENVKLARMRPIRFRSRDGLAINGYLTLPPGIPAKKLPTVLLVHGGPWARDSWGYNGKVQWLANRGYAVLQVNFRGSRGFGKKFLNAGNREWGGKMHADLVDGVRWAVRKGYTDPKRVAIAGEAYGGYAALVGLTETPDMFACGVDIVGPSNLITFMESIPAYWKAVEPILFDRVGHPVKDAELLRARSPLFNVDRITKPLLIAQGANDPRVRKEESRQLVEALKKAGKPVEYIEYPDEGHGFTKPENRLDFYGRAEKFLAQHIGGRFEESESNPQPTPASID